MAIEWYAPQHAKPHTELLGGGVKSLATFGAFRSRVYDSKIGAYIIINTGFLVIIMYSGLQHSILVIKAPTLRTYASGRGKLTETQHEQVCCQAAGIAGARNFPSHGLGCRVQGFGFRV